MFGSLVVVLPAPHDGGELVLRHAGEEWTFDATELLGGRTDAIAYVAFFSDVEHEVLPVHSGYRVTLTYNLYYGVRDEDATGTPAGLSVRAPPHADKTAVGAALSALLDDPSFLPNGGMLGFGLRHMYPFPTVWSYGDEDPLSSLGDCLKGGDDALFEACSALGLSPYLHLFYEDCGESIMMDGMVDFGQEAVGEDISLESALLDDGGTAVRSTFFSTESYERELARHKWPWEKEDRDDDKMDVYWVTETESWNGPRTQYLATGNEAALDYLYMSICLLARIGPSGRRIPRSEVQMQVVDIEAVEGQVEDEKEVLEEEEEGGDEAGRDQGVTTD